MTFCVCSVRYPLETLFQSDDFLFRFAGKSFDITYIRIVFFSPRPESFAIYRRQTSNGPWLPYQYYRCVYLIDSTIFRFRIIFFYQIQKLFGEKQSLRSLSIHFRLQLQFYVLSNGWLLLGSCLSPSWYSRYINTINWCLTEFWNFNRVMTLTNNSVF